MSEQLGGSLALNQGQLTTDIQHLQLQKYWYLHTRVEHFILQPKILPVCQEESHTNRDIRISSSIVRGAGGKMTQKRNQGALS